MTVASRQVTLYLGGLHVSAKPVIIKTLLGSCVAVCLYDLEAGVGGMNHFMLPRGSAEGMHGTTRFGVHAMDCLVTELLKAGATRSRLVAKVFGGARVLDLDARVRVAEQNIDFIHAYLDCERFPLVSEDVGGTLPRDVRFHTASGKVFVRKVATRASLLEDELRQAAVEPRPGPTILFEE
jgi:chemotaxis protein CheD